MITTLLPFTILLPQLRLLPQFYAMPPNLTLQWHWGNAVMEFFCCGWLEWQYFWTLMAIYLLMYVNPIPSKLWSKQNRNFWCLCHQTYLVGILNSYAFEAKLSDVVYEWCLLMQAEIASFDLNLCYSDSPIGRPHRTTLWYCKIAWKFGIWQHLRIALSIPPILLTSLSNISGKNHWINLLQPLLVLSENWNNTSFVR